MTRRKVDDSRKLTRKIGLRVTDPFYKKMQGWLRNSECRTLAELTRRILYKERIAWYHKDASQESAIMELAGIRKELKLIGRNINQITRHFHASPIPDHKLKQAGMMVGEYKKVELKVDVLLQIISQLAKKWLQK